MAVSMAAEMVVSMVFAQAVMMAVATADWMAVLGLASAAEKVGLVSC